MLWDILLKVICQTRSKLKDTHPHLYGKSDHGATAIDFIALSQSID